MNNQNTKNELLKQLENNRSDQKETQRQLTKLYVLKASMLKKTHHTKYTMRLLKKVEEHITYTISGAKVLKETETHLISILSNM